MARKVLVGKDAAVYSLTGGVLDINQGIVLSSPLNCLGVWKSIEVELEREWLDVTPSAAELKEKTDTTIDWRATLMHQERSGGSVGMDLFINFKQIYVLFQEEDSGRYVELWGGIAKDRYKRDRGEGEDTLDIENIGGIGPDGLSLRYL